MDKLKYLFCATLTVLVAWQHVKANLVPSNSVLICSVNLGSNEYGCQGKGYYCINESTRAYCRKSSPEPAILLPCKKSRPFCDPQVHKCVSQPTIPKENTTDPTEPNFNVTGPPILILDEDELQKLFYGNLRKGEYLPHPTKNDQFLYYSKDSQLYLYECMTDACYNHTATACSYDKSICQAFTDASLCKDKANSYVAYPPDKSYYAGCLDGMSPQITACETKYQEFNENTGQCEMKCKNNGLYPYPGDNTMFYMCPGPGQKEIAYSCSEGMVFDPEERICSE